MEFGGLPYDDSVPAPEPAAAGDMDIDHPMLDRALDDFPAPRRGSGSGDRAESGPVPEHVQGLLGRMGRGKVYLSEESTGVLFHDGDKRIKRDPQLARLAEELDKQDPTTWLAAISEQSTSPIRPNALFVSSSLIKHLSTAKVFTWCSELGATAMGMEWLNDTTLVLLFDTPSAALLGLSMLAKAGFDPTEGDDPLMERAAHGFPHMLLPRAEPKPEPVKPRAGDETMADEGADGAEPTATTTTTTDADVDAPPAEEPVRRRGRGAFSAREPSGSAHGAFDLAPLAPAKREQEFAEGVDPYARVTIRYALESDAKQRRDANQSEWYARHGRTAGKERAPQRRGYGREGPVELKDRVATAGEGREFARRIGRERAAPYARPERQRRSNVSDLDADLESFAARRDGREDEYQPRERRERGGGGGRRGERSERRPRGNREDLDAELDAMFSARKEE